jgi:hypothetical protein
MKIKKTGREKEREIRKKRDGKKTERWKEEKIAAMKREQKRRWSGQEKRKDA